MAAGLSESGSGDRSRRLWRSGSFARTGGALYDAVVDRDALMRPLARLLWGADPELLYAPLEAIRGLPPGARVLDVPCGGGWAFRALGPGDGLRYVGADVSPGMLDRARARAEREGLDQVELVEADIEAMPFPGAGFDLCVCANGLHCVDDPAAAVREIARCLAPGGRLVGHAVVRGELRRSDAWTRVMQLRGVFGPVADADELAGWLGPPAFARVELRRHGAVAHFDAVRAGDDA